MTLFENSFLELPVTLLRKIFPKIDKYYEGSSRHLDAYEHVWAGIIFNLLSAFLMRFSLWFGLVSIVVFIFHVIVKECIRDRIKHGYFHWIDIITRSAGFVLSAPFPVLAYLSKV